MPGVARLVLFFAGTVLNRLPTTTADPQLAAPSGFVPKTVVSDKVRFVVLAGMEGSGHHYVLAAEKAVFDANPELPRMYQHENQHPFYIPSAMGRSATNYVEHDLLGRQKMQTWAEDAAGLAGPTVKFSAHLASYPTRNGSGKVMQYDDLRKMADAAELEGLDMRVVYLKRSAQDIIIANTVHRLFQK